MGPEKPAETQTTPKPSETQNNEEKQGAKASEPDKPPKPLFRPPAREDKEERTIQSAEEQPLHKMDKLRKMGPRQAKVSSGNKLPDNFWRPDDVVSMKSDALLVHRTVPEYPPEARM